MRKGYRLPDGAVLVVWGSLRDGDSRAPRAAEARQVGGDPKLLVEGVEPVIAGNRGWSWFLCQTPWSVLTK